MPTAASTTFTQLCLEPFMNPEDARMTHVRLAASTTYPLGCLLGEVTATPGTFAPYNNALSNGTEVARMLLKYPCITDASGNITMGTAVGGNEQGVTHQSAPAYYKGVFQTADLPQSGTGLIDAAGVADLGKLVSGTTADGILRMG